jgi:predicted alpha/beta-hydrolase family hydrolase
MDSAFTQEMAQPLAARKIAVLRFEFAHMAARRQDGKKRPPNPQAKLLEQHWCALSPASAPTGRRAATHGGKSMGGMASLLVDELGADALVSPGLPFTRR